MIDTSLGNRHIGRLLDDRYRITSFVSQGGYASVFRCVDESSGKLRACKVLPKSTTSECRFRREVDVMKRLSPGCDKMVRCHHSGETDEYFFTIQDLCTGGDLANFAIPRPAGERFVARLVREIAIALDHMHHRDVIHGDVKPGNVFLSNAEEEDAFMDDVKLGDMGNAISMSDHPTSCWLEPIDIDGNRRQERCYIVDDLKGTPAFVSPEMLGHTIHPKSDVWSLGVVTFLLLSGSVPFDDRHQGLSRLWKSILQDRPDTSSAAWRCVSEEAKDFVTSCLRKAFVDRPSASECLTHPWIVAHQKHIYQRPFSTTINREGIPQFPPWTPLRT